MAVNHHLFLHETGNSSPLPSSDTSFHIQINYALFHQSFHPLFRCTPVNFHAINYFFPGRQILSPEAGAATVRDIFSRCEVSDTFLDSAVSEVLSFARNIAAQARNVGPFHVSLQANLFAISSDDNVNTRSQEDTDRAVRDMLEAEEVQPGLAPPARGSVDLLERVNYNTLLPSEKEGSCAVCLDDFVEKRGKGSVRMPCSHVFHEDCISEWLKTAHSCPLCRHELRPYRYS